MSTNLLLSLLPDDIGYHIYLHLDTSSALRLATTSQAFRHVALMCQDLFRHAYYPVHRKRRKIIQF